MTRAPSPVVRGLLWGLLAGLLIGGLGLFVLGAYTAIRGIDCTALTPEECALEREIAVSFAWRQVWVGGALALMGLAVFMLARGRLARAHPERNEP